MLYMQNTVFTFSTGKYIFVVFWQVWNKFYSKLSRRGKVSHSYSNTSYMIPQYILTLVLEKFLRKQHMKQNIQHSMCSFPPVIFIFAFIHSHFIISFHFSNVDMLPNVSNPIFLMEPLSCDKSRCVMEGRGALFSLFCF